jgi:hypothetical protein
MNVKSLVEMTGEVPTAFTIENTRYEVMKGSMADGSHSLMVWEMRKGKKYHLHYITYGETESEARENMKKLMLR